MPILINVRFPLDNESHLRRETTEARPKALTPSGNFAKSGSAKEARTSAKGPGGQQMQMLAGPEPVLSLVAAVLTRDRANAHTALVSYLLPGLFSVPAAGDACVLSLCLFL